jgi:hypothetical protein
MCDKRKSTDECFALSLKRSKSSNNYILGGYSPLQQQIKLHHNYLHDIGLRISSMIDRPKYDEICNYEQGIRMLCMGIDLKFQDMGSIESPLKDEINLLKDTAFEMLHLIEYLKIYILRA